MPAFFADYKWSKREPKGISPIDDPTGKEHFRIFEVDGGVRVEQFDSDGRRSVPHGGISGLRKNCSVSAFAGILESVGWSARFYGYWRRRESSPSIDLGQRLATHATGGAGAGGQLAGCHGASSRTSSR